MFVKLFHFLFGYKCKECGGIGRIAYFNGDMSGCPNCSGWGRVKYYNKNNKKGDTK